MKADMVKLAIAVERYEGEATPLRRALSDIIVARAEGKAKLGEKVDGVLAALASSLGEKA